MLNMENPDTYDFYRKFLKGLALKLVYVVVLMSTWGYKQRWKSFLTLDPRLSYLDLIKFYIEPPGVEETKIFSNRIGQVNQ